ncbi:MAG: M20/M25/M40 family metallo-hydrolase [Planctomycetes bacterium]|nr:M20/M25/M40 family metallo-hydrolase [Planctomycetota bacterium]
MNRIKTTSCRGLSTTVDPLGLEGGVSGSRGWFAAHVAVFLVVLALALVRSAPPVPLGLDAPDDVFSAGRVRRLLETIVRPGVPHPKGSRDHARVRKAILDAFARLGLDARVHETFFRDPVSGFAEQIQNIVVHLRGTEGEHAVALVAHYDSVPAAPGAADDASGVGSILEIARILAARPAPRNDIIFLVTDAEELGLVGARAFAAEHRLMDKIDVVLNWEARGSRGASYMFETGTNNCGLVALMARHCERMIATSLFPAVYERLPNDSDLTVFKSRGVRGMNFAFIGGLPHYHSIRDDLEHLDLGSVQHQGEHFLAMARALADTSIAEPPREDAVFFDVLAWHVIWWPMGWNRPFVLAVAALAACLMVVGMRSADRPWRSLGIALGVWPTALASAALLASGACWLVVAVAGEPIPWFSYPQPIWSVILGISLGVPSLVWTCLGRRVAVKIVVPVMIGYWAAAAIVVDRLLPGASYLFSVPAAVACVVGLLGYRSAWRWEFANLAFLFAACVLWLPLTRGLIDALGFRPSLVHSIPLTLIGLLIAPHTGTGRLGRGYRRAALAFAAAAFAVAMVVPTYTEQWPQPVDVFLVQDDKNASLAARARLGRVPESMRRASPDAPATDKPHYVQWNVEPSLVPPTVRVVSSEPVAKGRRIRLRVTPGTGQHRVIVAATVDRGSDIATDGMTPNLGSDVTIDGRAIEGPLRGVGLDFAEKAEVEIALTTAAPIRIRVTAYYYGPHPASERLRAQRPPWAAPMGRGDYGEVETEVTL